MSRCKKVNLTFDDAMSMLEVLKSEAIKITVIKKCPTISVELCDGVQVTATAESKKLVGISTTASQSVSLHYPKNEGTFDPNDEEDDDSKTSIVAETFNSKLDDKDVLQIVPVYGMD
jgi:hypothetical protein